MHGPVTNRDIEGSTNRMIRQKINGKFRQSKLIQIPLNNPVVSCNRTTLAMIRESNPHLRLPKWADAIRLQQEVGKRLLLEMLSCGPINQIL